MPRKNVVVKSTNEAGQAYGFVNDEKDPDYGKVLVEFPTTVENGQRVHRWEPVDEDDLRYTK